MTTTVRLADVARAAGVSQGTASNVFNRPEIVSDEVRERVAEAAGRLGYTGPDPKGRLLRAGKVNAIGLVLPGSLMEGFRDPFSQLIMEGIAEVCDARGAGLALVSAYSDADPTREAAAWNIRTALVDGFIVHCLERGDVLIDLARERGLPFVGVDRMPDEGDSAVLIDDRDAARRQAEHLVALGHRRIGIVSLEIVGDGRFGLVDRARREAARHRTTAARLAGYADAGLDLDALPVVEVGISQQHGAAAAQTILERQPDTTAILAMDDLTALGAMAWAAEQGIAVPERLSVIGFDDIPAAATATPPLTTVHQPIVEKGRRAAELVFDPRPGHIEMMDATLVVRGSTAPPPAA